MMAAVQNNVKKHANTILDRRHWWVSAHIPVNIVIPVTIRNKINNSSILINGKMIDVNMIIKRKKSTEFNSANFGI
jgi:hypothetical protein